MALTRDNEFWTAFETLAKSIERAAKLLAQMLENPTRDTEVLNDDITQLERAGDEVTRKVLTLLHQTWITPLDREEIHQLTVRLDDVLDAIQRAADRTMLYAPKESFPEATEMAQVLAKSAQDLVRCIAMLHPLKDGAALVEVCRTIANHERTADAIFHRALAKLFKDEAHPLEVVKWRDILEAVEDAVNGTRIVANVVEGVVLEHA